MTCSASPTPASLCVKQSIRQYAVLEADGIHPTTLQPFILAQPCTQYTERTVVCMYTGSTPMAAHLDKWTCSRCLGY